MVTLTHFGRFALLATITRLATSLPQAPLEQQPKPDGPLQLGKSGFEIVGDSPYDDWNIPNTSPPLYFHFGAGQGLGHTITADLARGLLDAAEYAIAARPAGEVVPAASTWQSPPLPPYPYTWGISGFRLVIANEGENPLFTKEIAVAAVQGMKKWLEITSLQEYLQFICLLKETVQQQIYGVLVFTQDDWYSE